jgi:uncharacterized protein YbaR (Trm112 family)
MDRHEIKFLLNYLENNRQHLNSLQNKFISSSKENYNTTGVLTKRQVESLYDIKDYIPAMVRGKAVFESDSENHQAQYSSVDYFTPYNM